MFLCWKRIYFIQKIETGDFPGGPVVKNLPSNAEDACSVPGQGIKIPHTMGQIHPHAATKESPSTTVKTQSSSPTKKKKKKRIKRNCEKGRKENNVIILQD